MVAVGLLDKAREMKKWLIEEEGIPARSQPKLEPSKTGYERSGPGGGIGFGFAINTASASQ